MPVGRFLDETKIFFLALCLHRWWKPVKPAIRRSKFRAPPEKKNAWLLVSEKIQLIY